MRSSQVVTLFKLDTRYIVKDSTNITGTDIWAIWTFKPLTHSLETDSQFIFIFTLPK